MKNPGLLIFFLAGIALNLAGAWMIHVTGFPLFLDTAGTMLSAAVLGPFIGALTGLASSLLTGMEDYPLNIPFAAVNIYTGVVVGWVSYKWGFLDVKKVALSSLFMGITCPVIGTVASVFLFSGMGPGPAESLARGLMWSGSEITAYSFIHRLPLNIADKALCAGIAFIILLYIRPHWRGLSDKNVEEYDLSTGD